MSYGYESIGAFSNSVTGIKDIGIDLLSRLDGERESAEERILSTIAMHKLLTMHRRDCGLSYSCATALGA
jgi:hypothetical protein